MLDECYKSLTDSFLTVAVWCICVQVVMFCDAESNTNVTMVFCDAESETNVTAAACKSDGVL